MTVVDACKLLHVSRSSFYAWHNRKPGKRAKENKVLSMYILGIHRSFEERYKVRYGVRRIHAELRLRWKRVRRLMRQMGLYGTHYRRPWKTTIPAPDTPAIPDLVKRDFTSSGAGILWVT
ncbi:MAG: IS3 family transposase [Firmicutes bacterium]|nr:IS3 family transposase [Bacillota bacterium]